MQRMYFDFDYVQQWAQCSALARVAQSGGSLQRQQPTAQHPSIIP